MARSIVGCGTDSAANQKLYDEWAANYEKDVRSWGYDAPERVAELVRMHERSPEAASVLDAGAGDGLSGTALKHVGFKDIIGIDLSPDLIVKAQSKGCYRKTEVADLSKPLTYAQNEFDVCTCVGVLTYLEPESGVLSELVRVTKPGGLVCYTNRTDKVDKWDVEETKLIDNGAWEKLHISDPMPYLPNNPEYGDSVKVIIHLYRVLKSDSHASKKAKTDALPAAVQVKKHLLLRYEYVEGILEKRTPHRAGHLAHWKALGSSLVMGGATDPPQEAYIVVKDLDRQKLDALVKEDPYYVNGLVPSYEIKEWNVVIGSAV